jgi:uncharacterized protein YkwD
MLMIKNTSHLTPRHLLALAAALALATLASLAVIAAGSPTQAFACKHVNTPTKALKKSTARKAMRCLFNGTRKHHGVHKLRPSGDLADAAQNHTALMRRTRCFSHQCPGEGALGSRIAQTGYFHGARTYRYAENILYNQHKHTTPRDTFKGWMHSSGHRFNILSGSSRDLGIGVSAGHGPAWWTADFGFAH